MKVNKQKASQQKPTENNKKGQSKVSTPRFNKGNQEPETIFEKASPEVKKLKGKRPASKSPESVRRQTSEISKVL